MGSAAATETAQAAEDQRVCANPICGTVLSRYNDNDHCALHAPMVTPRTRGVKSSDL